MPEPSRIAGVIADQARVARRHVAQPVAEDLRVGRLAAGLTPSMPLGGIELARAVVGDRVVLGELVALALARDDVQELRALAAS